MSTQDYSTTPQLNSYKTKITTITRTKKKPKKKQHYNNYYYSVSFSYTCNNHTMLGDEISELIWKF